MLIGAHNSIAGGIWNAPVQATEVGGECMQIFCKNQRQWNAKPLEPEDAERFKQAVKDAGLGPTMVHDSYLINMGNPDVEKRMNAQAAFERELERCEAMEVQFLNFHPGSHMAKGVKMRDDPTERMGAIDRIAERLAEAHDNVPGKVKFTIENAAGQGTNVGSTWEEVGRLADALEAHVGRDRMAICVDTQHTWAAGYDWVDDYDGVWDRFDDQVGLRRLEAFHLNDSKQPCGARVDRHDNIPTGFLGEGFWQTLMTDKRFTDCCGYLETPLENEDITIWASEIAYLKALRDGA
ncbi:MAG: deoxyribonuclease IV [Thermoplasmatota archaeon]